MTQIIADLLRYRIGIAAQEGAIPEKILALAGVDPELMASTQERYNGADELRIWQAIVELTGRQDIGLVCGQQFPTQAISMVGYVMANSPNLGTAIENVCKYQRLIGDTMGMRLDQNDNKAILSIELWSEWFDPLRYTIDMMMAAALSWTVNNTPGKIWPASVGFHYEQPENTHDYAKLFGPALVTFGRKESHLVYSASDLSAPILGANQQNFAYFDEKVQQAIDDFDGRDTFSFQVRQQILQLLKGTTPTVAQIASPLAVSVRTLQKHLKNEGVSFSELLSAARRDLAIRYLNEKQVSHTEIAYLLGFSEVSVFSRSFKKWTGLSPSEYSR